MNRLVYVNIMDGVVNETLYVVALIVLGHIVLGFAFVIFKMYRKRKQPKEERKHDSLIDSEREMRERNKKR